MKRSVFLFMLLLTGLWVSAQVRVVGKHRILTDAEGVDYLILFDKIDNSSLVNSSEIHYISGTSGAYVQWFLYDGSQKQLLYNVNSVSGRESYIEPQHSTTYIINEEGKEFSIHVQSLADAGTGSVVHYTASDGRVLTYDTEQKTRINLTENLVEEKINQVMADDDEPEKIACKITTITAERTETHENQRPGESSIDGSAPLDIQFFSNPEGDVRNYLWQIYRDGELIITRTEQDHRYVFEHSGKYRVLLMVSNAEQEANDSINIDVSESQLMVPSVFTPNGDGYNDEFRVAYTSIAKFHASIVNRWGRVIFSWTDPQRGWDGTIGGKPAPEGTYFYIITATGSDGKPYKLKGHLNLLR